MKTHLVVDVGAGWRQRTSATARRYVRKARERQTFERIPATADNADALWAMYQTTIRHHAVTGLARLSRDAIARQLDVDGALLVLAKEGARILGAILSYRHGETANAHLFFLSQEARAAHTSYGLIDATLGEFERLGCQKVNLGGVAGARDDTSGGLYRFKQNWTRETRTAFLCGAVLQPRTYEILTMGTCDPKSAYFPLYREPTTSPA
ncbi:GNAT family N-acetyltransferase [Breoghania corrubedonensis]|nr:GNAT family N-acetyltransferase [Breoghania corrubedonensis]